MNQIKELREHVEKEFGIDNLRERRRYNDIVNARMVYSYILRGLGYTLTEIGKSLGKHHATIINYLDNMEGYLKTDPVLRKKFYKVSSCVFR
jgi:chromosomal replication initiation ATPase DnaA